MGSTLHKSYTTTTNSFCSYSFLTRLPLLCSVSWCVLSSGLCTSLGLHCSPLTLIAPCSLPQGLAACTSAMYLSWQPPPTPPPLMSTALSIHGQMSCFFSLVHYRVPGVQVNPAVPRTSLAAMGSNTASSMVSMEHQSRPVCTTQQLSSQPAQYN